VAKPELGTKRVCPETGRKFYDLNQSPVISPYTGHVVPIETPSTRSRPEPAAARAVVPEAVEAPETAEVELVSLEEAEAEAEGGGKKVAVAGEEDVEVDDEALDDAAFIVPEEEEDEDVTTIIGGDIEDEEET
jgi:uncharacterized protein (TIGR02300 family)